MKTCLDCGKKCSGVRCKECNRKFSGKSFDFGQWHFDTQIDLDRAIHQIILKSPKNVEFNNPFLQELINTYHTDVKKRNYKVTKLQLLDWNGQVGKWEFCRDRFRGGVFVIGFFEPINEWHGVTLYPHKRKWNVKEKLILALRQKWSENTKKRDINQKCEICGEPFPELHHDSVSFSELAEKCLKEFSPEELENGIGDDWWLHESEADAVPDNHPAVLKMLELHKDVKYKWLCWKHHKETFGGNRDD